MPNAKLPYWFVVKHTCISLQRKWKLMRVDMVIICLQYKNEPPTWHFLVKYVCQYGVAKREHGGY